MNIDQILDSIAIILARKNLISEIDKNLSGKSSSTPTSGPPLNPQDQNILNELETLKSDSTISNNEKASIALNSIIDNFYKVLSQYNNSLSVFARQNILTELNKFKDDYVADDTWGGSRNKIRYVTRY